MWQIPRLSSSDLQTLFQKVREVLRLKHSSLRTEETYIRWIRYFLRFHQELDPIFLGKTETERFLTHLPYKKEWQPQLKIKLGLPCCFFIKKSSISLWIGSIT